MGHVPFELIAGGCPGPGGCSSVEVQSVHPPRRTWDTKWDNVNERGVVEN